MEAETAAGGILAFREVKPFIEKLITEPLEELAHIGGDWLRAWRNRNLIRLFEITKKLAEEHGYDPKPLRPDILVPIMEAASKTDDPTLQQVFARLLSAFIDPSSDDPHPAFIKIAADLSPLDAHVLNGLSKPLPAGADTAKIRLDWDERGYTVQDLRKNILPTRLAAVSDDTLIISGDNLDRLGLVNCEYGAGNASSRHGTTLMRVTPFGRKFWEVAGGEVRES